MPEIGTSGSMSGDGKRGVAKMAVVTAPILDSTISTDAAPLADVGFRGNADVLEYHRDGVGVVMWAITTALFRRLSGPRRRDLFRLDRETLHVGAGQDGTVCRVSAVTVFTKSNDRDCSDKLAPNDRRGSVCGRRACQRRRATRMLSAGRHAGSVLRRFASF